MRFIASSTCCLLIIVCTGIALAQKAELRREIGRGCSAVAAGQAALVSFPTRTSAKVEVPVEGILMKPSGEGPFPAVVVMHGGPGIFPPNCYRGAQELLVGWGYSALLVDSFSAGFPEKGRNHQPTLIDRTQDAWAAAKYLASRSDVKPDRIGVVGWSLGGLATLLSVSENVSADHEGAPNLAAAIAIGPECPRKLQGLRTPLLILHGEADQSNPVEDCMNMRVVGANSSALELVTYPGARHTFDFPGSPDYDPIAAEDSGRRMEAFFQRRLQSQ